MSAEVPAHEKKTQGNKLPQLHALEEDDEFEEFAVEGTDLFNKMYGSNLDLSLHYFEQTGKRRISKVMTLTTGRITGMTTM